jgi:anti-anti-sigma factor
MREDPPSVELSQRRFAAYAAPAFQCVLRREVHDDLSWLGVVGEVDLAAVPILRKSLRQAELQQRRVLDLRAVTFMDCAGIHVIVDAGDRARRTAARLVVIRGPAQLDRLFLLTRAVTTLEIVHANPFELPVLTPLRLPGGDADDKPDSML